MFIKTKFRIRRLFFRTFRFHNSFETPVCKRAEDAKGGHHHHHAGRPRISVFATKTERDKKDSPTGEVYMMVLRKCHKIAKIDLKDFDLLTQK